jgi:hypothetical protein
MNEKADDRINELIEKLRLGIISTPGVDVGGTEVGMLGRVDAGLQRVIC